MGLDLEQFVHPERISSQLICPICTQVLDRPVQTATEHLFCEDELLEWMTRSDLCPITKTKLDPSQIRKPGRIVLNMLAELEMYCKNRPHGCTWTGSREHLLKHQEECTCRSKEDLLQEIKEKDEKMLELVEKVDFLTTRNMELVEENLTLKEKIEEYQHRIRVFHALIPQTFHMANEGNRSSTSSQEQYDGALELRSFADSLSILLQDDDEQLVDSSQLDISHESNHTDYDERESKEDHRKFYIYHNSPDRTSLNSRGLPSAGYQQHQAAVNRLGSPSSPVQNTVSDAERLRRLRGLTSLSKSPSTSSSKSGKSQNNAAADEKPSRRPNTTSSSSYK